MAHVDVHFYQQFSGAQLAQLYNPFYGFLLRRVYYQTDLLGPLQKALY